MPARPPSCPRCAGTMEDGFLLDEGYGKRAPVKWIEGVPEFRFFNLAIRGRRQIKVQSFRCRQCGYLESYAPS